MAAQQCLSLMKLFKALANDKRLRLLHNLAKSAGLCLNNFASAAIIKPQGIFDQLQRPDDPGMLTPRGETKLIHIRNVDRCVIELITPRIWLLEDMGGF